jgi:hypothetical protein
MSTVSEFHYHVDFSYICYFFFLIGSNIILRSLVSNILNLLSSINIREHVSHPYRTKDKIIILKHLDSGRRDNIFCTEWKEALPEIELFQSSYLLQSFSNIRTVTLVIFMALFGPAS